MLECAEKEICAYIAGFLDGDGSIYISPYDKTFKLRASFSNVCLEVIVLIRDFLSMRINSNSEIRERHFEGNRRVEFLLDYKGMPVKNLCALLSPFLILKKNNAELSLQFPVSKIGIALSAKEKEKHKALYEQMKALNQNSHNIIVARNNKSLATEDMAWLAGFFDAKGSIHISRFKRKNGTGYCLGISVSNTNRSVLEYIISKFAAEGKIVDHENLCENRKEGHEFYIYGNEAKSLLKVLYPYLIVKKEKAVLALAFPISERGSAGRTVAENNGQKLAHLQMAVLNKKGSVLS